MGQSVGDSFRFGDSYCISEFYELVQRLFGLRYNNITDTRLPWDKVWTPDIVLYNRWATTLWVDWSLNRNTCECLQGCILCNTFCMFKRIKRCKLTAVSWITNTDGVVCSAGDGEQGREMRTLIQVSFFLVFFSHFFACFFACATYIKITWS